jgi:D-arabinose 1-dehydrogenase-like Zn-dependent alcohol dehydrogenase
VIEGLTTDGGMAEYIMADAETTIALPDGVSFEQGAPLMCAGVGIYRRCLTSRDANVSIDYHVSLPGTVANMAQMLTWW